ncbi:MAG: excinuclease ABC subunit UvrA [Candidatus Sumerlaeia bacterium]|nr:excinuclease ABC subunit UvrA [Candidatus Sumerlaeia bacterium]
MSRAIEVFGARTHNLKNIRCRFPHGQLTVITGVSGSGKSSLAFDTLFAEGQRRFVESMSTYARQFIEQMPRPDVDQILNLPPAIALEQRNAVKNARSTVGTATEVYDYLRLLFAKIGRTFCPDCRIEVRPENPQSAADALLAEASGGRAVVLAPVLSGGGSFEALRTELIRAGYFRIWVNGEVLDLEAMNVEQASRLFPAIATGETPATNAAVEVVIDRLRIDGESRSRLNQALETAFQIGKGKAVVEIINGEAPRRGNGRHRFFNSLVCPQCERTFRAPEPNLFSFYSPVGSCPACQGFGRTADLAMDKIIPNPNLTLAEKPIAPWNGPVYRQMYPYMRRLTRGLGLPFDKPISQFTARERKILIEGEGDWDGIRGFFDWLETKKYKVQVRVMIARYRDFATCKTCRGTRLVPDALNVRVDGHTIADLNCMAIADLRRYFDSLRLPSHDEKAAERLLHEIRSRLTYLVEVGLGYLTLDRQTRTLSGGESQRINLSAALGSGLTETLYVLDEPTVGLHPRDTSRLLNILHALKRNGNTVVVVEHDPTMMRGADRILDLGPAAGERGGEVICEGTMETLLNHPTSLTGRYLRHGFGEQANPSDRSGKSDRFSNKAVSREPAGFVHVRGAREHNLKNIDVAIPLGVLTAVTGVSGSGKSTLIRDVLYAAYRRRYGKGNSGAAPASLPEVGAHDRLEGFDIFDDVIFVDQSPPSKSIRSNPVTYTGAYDAIRQLLASTDEARRRGITAGHFSFNVAGGRCDKCAGTGQLLIDMHFLADVAVTCEVCDGKRFKKNILEIKYKGLNIVEILELTADRAADFFHDQRKIVRALQPLRDVGLGYLRLGQNTSTLSGGEAQRLKLAGHLAERGSRRHLMMLFDEPTTGLHPADLDVLMNVFRKLLNRGATLVIIEHNLDLIAQADWIIDLGPEGGDGGGQVVFAGPRARFLDHPTSHTAAFLRKHLGAE